MKRKVSSKMNLRTCQRTPSKNISSLISRDLPFDPTGSCKMLAAFKSGFEIKNTSKVEPKAVLKKLISGKFSSESKKFFYSIEITPKERLKIDFADFKTLPLFIDITWIGDNNLKASDLVNSPAFQLATEITSSQVVNSITCYHLNDEHLTEILAGDIKNFTVLRGDIVDENQKYKHANELIKEIRERTDEVCTTIFAAGYPETHAESKSSEDDLFNLKRKVEAGVDIILTQVGFSAEIFAGFVRKCRDIGIPEMVPIVPGLYIPHDMKELDLILRITRVSMEPEIYRKFDGLKNDEDAYKKFSILFMTELIRDIQELSHEFIPGYHFFTMNNFEMIQRLINVVDFSDE